MHLQDVSPKIDLRAFPRAHADHVRKLEERVDALRRDHEWQDVWLKGHAKKLLVLTMLYVVFARVIKLDMWMLAVLGIPLTAAWIFWIVYAFRHYAGHGRIEKLEAERAELPEAFLRCAREEQALLDAVNDWYHDRLISIAYTPGPGRMLVPDGDPTEAIKRLKTARAELYRRAEILRASSAPS